MREREGGGWKKGRIPGVLNETMGGTVQQIVTDSDGSAREQRWIVIPYRAFRGRETNGHGQWLNGTKYGTDVTSYEDEREGGNGRNFIHCYDGLSETGFPSLYFGSIGEFIFQELHRLVLLTKYFHLRNVYFRKKKIFFLFALKLSLSLSLYRITFFSFPLISSLRFVIFSERQGTRNSDRQGEICVAR